MNNIKQISSNKCFNGVQYVCSHFAQVLNCDMRFAIFIPENKKNVALPTLFWLSGLTCTEQNFITKAGAQRIASELGIIIVAPDTSPRGPGVADEPNNEGIGMGASFYLNAQRAPWQKHYQMETYIAEELPALLAKHFPIDPSRVGMMGHSMGGHGALCLAIKYPHYFKTLSAFAPIAALSKSPRGQQILTQYLGDDDRLWEENDASSLIEKRGWQGPPILIDQGTADTIISNQFNLDYFIPACQKANVAYELRYQEGYDHGYYFISTFIEDHLRYHYQFLG